MLTPLKFRPNPESLAWVKQDHCKEYPSAFILVPNMDDPRWATPKGMFNEESIIICIIPIEDGIYDTGFSFNYEIEDLTDFQLVAKRGSLSNMGKDGNIKILPDKGPIGSFFEDNPKPLYGVADNIEQVKEYFAPAINNPDVQFVISITELHKKNEPERDGWRWHKWGEYIGTKNSQCEYLADEPEIDKVVIFHGYYIELKNPPIETDGFDPTDHINMVNG